MRILILLASLILTAYAADEKKIVCYFGSWSVYRPGDGKFMIENINPRLCTHLIYSFVGLSGNEVKPLDLWQDVADNWGKDGFGRFNALRQLSPGLKTLVAIGGWNEGSQKYSKMASSSSSRAAFVKSAVAFVKKYNFDGLDLDWEYPAQRGGSMNDVQNYVELLKEMRQAFDEEGLLLSAAVGAAKLSASKSYNISEVSKYLHFINLMTYDLHGSWEPHTGLNAPLYAAEADTGLSAELTIEACVKYWLSEGVDAAKLTLGVASYGRTFTLADPNNNGIGAPTQGPGVAGPYTRESGFYGYNEICAMVKSNEWTVTVDKERRAVYAYRGNQWVGYDDVASITEKAEYAKKMGLGGVMVWSIETDDFGGRCGESYPLMNALNRVLRTDASIPSTTARPVQGDQGKDGRTSSTEAAWTPFRTITPRATTVGTEAEWTPFRTTTPRVTTFGTEVPISTSGTTVPNPGNEADICSSGGIIPDPVNCEKFTFCYPKPNGGYTRLTMTCPTGLCYRSDIDACDWKI